MGANVVEKLLHVHGFELCRSKKHKVYKRHDGKVFVRPSTPSDFRAENNNLADLCRLLGVKKSEAVESLRRRRVVVEDKGPEPWLMPAVVDEAPAPPVAPLPMSREDRRLAKRIARIERNQKAKQDKFEAKWKRFMEEDAVLYVPTNEFVFIDLEDEEMLLRLEGLLDDLVEGDDTIAAQMMDHGEVTTMPHLVLHMRKDGERVMFVFEDGSYATGKLRSTPKRMTPSTGEILFVRANAAKGALSGGN